MNKYFDKNTRVLDLIEKYPRLLDYMVSIGFKPLLNPLARTTVAKITSIGRACELRNINYDLLEKNLVNIIEEGESLGEDISLNDKNLGLAGADFIMKGVLPCPIRLAIEEEMARDQGIQNISKNPYFDLRAAAVGLDHIEEGLSKDIKDMPDIIISVGFQSFFDKNIKKKLFSNGDYIFKHPSLSQRFDNQNFSLRDPKARYLIFSIVPCVFLINKKVIGDRICQTWSDLLKEEFENSISIPLGDLDMFNVICLNIYAQYGIEGIRQLKKANKVSLHPAQMAKSYSKVEAPAVSIVPYFFAKTAYNNRSSIMQAVWPKDGAIISPIFLLAKRERQREVDTFLNFLSKKDLVELFSANGKFPLTLEGTDHFLEDDKTLKWIGWDFIDDHDIDSILKECKAVFA